jgi:tyrosinase
LSARLAAVGQDRKLYLVAKGLGTDAPPETIYQLYLGLPQGTVPSPDGPYYVGALNFFNALRGGAEAGRSDPRFLSFDVTRLLKSLQSKNALGDIATVTIVPAGQPRTSARPVIGTISPVAQ